MNNVLARVQDEHTKKFNEKVVEGTAKRILRAAPEFIDEIITTSVSTMNRTGLEYHGWRRLTPKEEFHKMFTSADKKTNYDMARSDLYMIELRFVYRGKPMPRFLLLPYAGPANIMTISDTKYSIVPVLSDTVISPSYKEVFVRLLKDKLTFSRFTRNYIVDQEKVLGQIIHSNAYRLAGRQIQNNLGTAFPPVSLYILGNSGLRAAFQKYANIDDILITTDSAEEFRKHYKIYKSSKIKPRGHKEYNYIGHDIKVMVPRTKINESNETFIDNFIFGVLYALDLFPEASMDLVALLDNHDVKNEKLFWKLILGRIIFKNGYSVEKMMSEMNDHFKSLDNYMDNLIKDKLHDVGVIADSYFDLVAVILTNYNQWLLNSKEHNSNIDNRYIDILYYMLYDIIYGFNRALFDINKKGNKRELSYKEVDTIFQNSITAKKIFGIIKSGSGMSLAVSYVESSGDNKYLKITSQLADQSQGNGVKRGSGSQFPESTKTLRGQDLWLGSLLYLGKSAPSPRFRANLYMDYDLRTGNLKMEPKIKQKIEYLDTMLRGKLAENQKILDSEIAVTLDSVG